MTSTPMTEDDVTAVLGQMNSFRDKALFVLGIKTGFRISELLSLQVKDVYKKEHLSVKRSHMKGKYRSRTVPLHKDAQEAVSQYIESQTPFPHSESKLFQITRMHAWRIIHHSARKAGVKGTISTQSMRKTFAMNVYHRTGKDVLLTQKALGHASLSSTSHYLSVSQGVVDKAILGD